MEAGKRRLAGDTARAEVQPEGFRALVQTYDRREPQIWDAETLCPPSAPMAQI